MKNVLILLTVLVFILGCEKVHTYYVPEEIKRNFSFKEGSYWIYRDSISGREDSCYIKEISTSMAGRDYGGGRSESNYEIFSVHFLQKPVDKTIKEETRWTIQYNKLGFGLAYSTKSILSGLDRGFLLFNDYYPFRISPTVQKLPTYILNSNTFTNVYNLTNNKDKEGEYPILFNDSVGYLKMNVKVSYAEYNDTTKKFDSFHLHQIWELQRCRVIK